MKGFFWGVGMGEKGETWVRVSLCFLLMCVVEELCFQVFETLRQICFMFSWFSLQSWGLDTFFLKWTPRFSWNVLIAAAGEEKTLKNHESHIKIMRVGNTGYSCFMHVYLQSLLLGLFPTFHGKIADIRESESPWFWIKMLLIKIFLKTVPLSYELECRQGPLSRSFWAVSCSPDSIQRRW